MAGYTDILIIGLDSWIVVVEIPGINGLMELVDSLSGIVANQITIMEFKCAPRSGLAAVVGTTGIAGMDAGFSANR